MSEVPKDDLQFDKAEFAAPATAPACASCQAQIGSTYFEVNGHVVCEHCSVSLVAGESVASSQPPYFAALGWGVLAAVGGAIGWALMLSAGIQLALVSIGIGWLVGKAIHRATRGRGGLPFQLMAVTLTYLSIVAGWVPHVLKINGIPLDSKTFVAAFIPTLPLPVTGVGVLGVLILVFGLYQAFRMNPEVKFNVRGPFQLASRPPAVGSPTGG